MMEKEKSLWSSLVEKIWSGRRPKSQPSEGDVSQPLSNIEIGRMVVPTKETLESAAGSIAALELARHLRNGNSIDIPSLGMVITKADLVDTTRD